MNRRKPSNRSPQSKHTRLSKLVGIGLAAVLIPTLNMPAAMMAEATPTSSPPVTGSSQQSPKAQASTVTDTTYGMPASPTVTDNTYRKPASSASPTTVTTSVYDHSAIIDSFLFNFDPDDDFSDGKQTTTIIAMKLNPDGTESRVPNATIYLKFQQTEGGGHASVGNDNLTRRWIPFTTDDNGQVRVTYTLPATLPDVGRDILSVANSTNSEVATYNRWEWDLGERIYSLKSMTPLENGVQTLTFRSSDLKGNPRQNSVWVRFENTQGGGTAVLGDRDSTVEISTEGQYAATDANGNLIITYKAPATLPERGMESILLENRNNVQILNKFSYFYPVNSYAPNYEMNPDGSTTVTLTAQNVYKQAVPGAAVNLTYIQALQGGSAAVGGIALQNMAQCTTECMPQEFIADANGRVSIRYTPPSSPPASGLDVVYAFLASGYIGTGGKGVSAFVLNDFSHPVDTHSPNPSLSDLALVRQLDGFYNLSIRGLTVGESVYVYDAPEGGKLLGQATASLHQNLTNVTGLHVNTEESYVYVSQKKAGMTESMRIPLPIVRTKITSMSIVGNSIVITYNTSLNADSLPDLNDFIVYAHNRRVSVKAVDIAENQLKLRFNPDVMLNGVVDVRYIPGSTVLKNMLGQNLFPFFMSQGADPGSITTKLLKIYPSSIKLASGTSGPTPRVSALITPETNVTAPTSAKVVLELFINVKDSSGNVVTTIPAGLQIFDKSISSPVEIETEFIPMSYLPPEGYSISYSVKMFVADKIDATSSSDLGKGIADPKVAQ